LNRDKKELIQKQLIALSGISADNIRQTLISGFDDDVAL
jgi:hypothetical protein